MGTQNNTTYLYFCVMSKYGQRHHNYCNVMDHNTATYFHTAEGFKESMKRLELEEEEDVSNAGTDQQHSASEPISSLVQLRESSQLCE